MEGGNFSRQRYEEKKPPPLKKAKIEAEFKRQVQDIAISCDGMNGMM